MSARKSDIDRGMEYTLGGCAVVFFISAGLFAAVVFFLFVILPEVLRG